MAKNVYEVKTVESSLNVRNAPNGDVIGKLAKGSIVEVVSASNGWAKICHHGTMSYVSSSYLAPAKNAYQVTMKSGTLNLRNAPETGAVIGSIMDCALVKVISSANGWAQVETEDGKKGYASMAYLAPATAYDLNLA
ncbi:MAG: SH3 domain-containing protein [Bacteroidales bacterium]|nr:SH3 domain-containing protein [Candidatus Physcocola equi]